MTTVEEAGELARPRRIRAPRAFSSEPLLADPGYVQLVRWVFTARLVCLALAAPAVFSSSSTTAAAAVSLGVLTVSSLVLGRSDVLIRMLIRHPLLASLDTATSVVLLVSVPVGQPATLTVICSALLGGLLFPRAVLVLLLLPLVVASLGAPAALVGTAPTTWTGWLALVAGLPSLVIGVCAIGSGVRRSTQATIQARHEVAEALAAVGAAEERARLARDMHDSVGKSIHGIALGAKALRRLVDSDPALARDVAGSLAGAADQAAREARTLLLALRTDQPDRPTVDVVTQVLRQWERETGIPAHLADVVVVDADAEVTRQLAAALGEILHNIAKHAHASEVLVRLVGTDAEIELVVVDDGVGFDAVRGTEAERGGHFGLRGLRERASAVKGSVTIDSVLGEGTTVTWTAQTTAAAGVTTDAVARATVRVALADDNSIVRMGVRSLLATAADVDVVGEASNGVEAVALVRRTCPDVMLLDVRMPRQDGVNVASEIADQTAVIMLTYSESPEIISAAVRAGARGYLVHGHFDEDELLSAVRLAARGIGTFSAQAMRALSNPAPGKAALASRYGLSEREADIMQLIAQGSANREIAAELFIAEKTVKNHINRIFTKLAANNRGHAVALWLAGS